ncbi:alpha-2-macroglobulin family protein [Rhabdochromatium marinum]|uniref:alpha-2-macroglobulin family protein n=1 Tax=Rhabdochromatium marinum TaxID=48729 RepID=UPI001904C5BD|nr:alpha-2-macroglobulin [Rhabdochromatium marinum]MBK1649595.1 alpha-2-macroglobulin [Rhabdochromatium marinum]
MKYLPCQPAVCIGLSLMLLLLGPLLLGADAALAAEFNASGLDFLPDTFLREAEQQRATLQPPASASKTPPPASLVEQARAAHRQSHPQRAYDLYRQALQQGGAQRFAAWLGLARAAVAQRPQDWKRRRQMQHAASAAAINAYLSAGTKVQAASALATLGQALEQRRDWRPAIRTWRAALALQEQADHRAHLEQLVAEHGFRILGHEVSSDARDPRICINFSDGLASVGEGPPLSDYVTLDQTDLAIEPEDRAICIDGVRHGERYRIGLRAGLPAHDGETLSKTVELEVYVRDRRPSVHFPGRAYVLPSRSGAALPIVSVNTEVIQGWLYHIGERALGGLAADKELFTALNEDSAQQLAERSGEQLWQGEFEVRQALNQDVTSTLPLAELIGTQHLKPGLYVLRARARERLQDDYNFATQWFLISDLGLSALNGADGLHVLVRSLASAEPLAGVRLRLLAVNQQVLSEARTDAQGYARFDPGLLRGSGGNRVARLSAISPNGDYGFLALDDSPFDLTDRGVAGRAAPGPIDVFLTAERGLYRPGETVALTALARDAQAHAVTDLPLTYRIKRPDGVEWLRQPVADQGLGAHPLDVTLRDNAMRGTWQVAVYLDPEQPALAHTRFLVEDFEPERLEFEPHSPAEWIDPRDPPQISLEARYLYGAPAAHLRVEGQARLVATDRLAAFPGYRFGLADEDFTPELKLFSATETDAQGHAELTVELPDGVAASQPLQAHISLSVIEASGRPVERELQRPLRDGRARLGIKPLFDGAVPEGSQAAFELIALDAAGQPRAAQNLSWTLSRVRTSFQWYQRDGDWTFEPIKERRRVASGTLTLEGDAPARLEVPVDWGAYELAVQPASSQPSAQPSKAGPLVPATVVPASLAFHAGWYVSPKAYDTPDALKVVLDKVRYAIGETARVHLEPRFPGLALVMVMNQGLVSLHPVQVAEEGAEIELPVTADWGSGAYITAALYRPMDVAARRMPQRAIGLQWAGVDPGARQLEIELQAPAQVQPRGPLSIEVAITNLPPGEPALVSLAAVDEGILQLTDFQTPAPDAWYFGQRQLGFELRDLYARLINPMQGEPGRLRTGGDRAAALMRIDGPPPSEALLAFHSGVLAVDAQGRAQVQFELPDFNGRARLMAMAWTRDGVGHAEAATLIRDPIVMSASLPRFLAPGDHSRVLVELAHVEGPAGPVHLELSSHDAALALTGPTTADMELAPEGRARAEFALSAQAPGTGELNLVLTTPAGQQLTKTLHLQVRDLTPPVQISQSRELAPGGPGLELGAGLLAAASDQALQPGSESWQVSVTGAGTLDLVGLLQALDRYPYGCAEQLTSRALPLLYVDTLALGVGDGTKVDTPTDAPTDAEAVRVRDSIRELLGKQAADGGFGLWSPHDSDQAVQTLWLNAYVTDFLTRAVAQGYAAPDTAVELALDNLKNHLAYSPDFTAGGEGIAYALYVLARNGRLSLGDLRYYFETKLKDLATPMARAQLGAALAVQGAQPRARQALQSAYTLWRFEAARPSDTGWRPDFGSRLRDGAALLALAAEHLPAALPLTELAHKLNDQVAAKRAGGGFSHTLSTQEQAWLVLAAQAQMSGGAAPQLEIDGHTHSGPWTGRFDAVDLATTPVVIRNLGTQPQTAIITVTGQPRMPPPAGGRGYHIKRSYYTLGGARVDATRVTQGTRLIALLEITAEQRGAARLMIEDPLPAGLEIDNPHLLSAGDLSGLAGLASGPEPLASPDYQAFLSDRMLAAVALDAEDPRSFRLAYAVRAISPGRFVHPQARVEAMYRPAQRGWTDADTLEVVAAEALE